MKGAFYPKLAQTSISNNKRLYIPYMLTCIGMIAMFYIVNFLSVSETVSRMRGGTTLQGMLTFGNYVLGVFAVIFLFYTNSFLTKRRKKEFGLYHILGMNKRNIARILASETLIIGGITLVFGLGLGILLSKLAELGVANLISGDIAVKYEIAVSSIIMTAAVFAGIDLLLFLYTVIQIGTSKTVDLVHSEQVGEKKPKGNVVLAILGAGILAGAYYIAVTIDNPISAMGYFIIAVIMVIVASYLLFIAGSVFVCNMLKKNKGYYYKPNHFVSVSSMAYRMKRNGAGLASICILSTMVLVMISTTSCLYLGAEDSLREQYPREYNFYEKNRDYDDFLKGGSYQWGQKIQEALQEAQIEFTNVNEASMVSLVGQLQGEKIEWNHEKNNTVAGDYSNLYTIRFLTLETFNKKANMNISLEDDQALLYDPDQAYPLDTLMIEGITFDIAARLDSFPGEEKEIRDMISTLYFIINDFSELKPLAEIETNKAYDVVTAEYSFGFDLALYTPEIRENVEKVLDKVLFEKTHSDHKMFYWEDRESERVDFYGVYGGLLFIGILLSIVFSTAAALIIYYKQVTEGYEDQSRFEIMQNVGMTKGEIKKSINSQLLVVFFLPLIGAASHLTFAFPIISKMLQMFRLYNTGLFATICAVSFAGFAILYVCIYKATSNAYLKIVSK